MLEDIQLQTQEVDHQVLIANACDDSSINMDPASRLIQIIFTQQAFIDNSFNKTILYLLYTSQW